MVQDNKVQKQLWKLYDSLRGTAGYYNLFSNTVHLIFLKFIITYGDQLDNLGLESFKAISAFKRKYDSARANGDPLVADDIYQLFRTLDSEHVFGDVKLSECLQGYDNLFRDLDNQRALIRVLDDFDIELNKDYLVNFFELLIQQCSRDVRMTGESTTTKALRKIGTKLLDIKPNDILLNCFSGFSTLMFDVDSSVQYIGYEINAGSFVISKMLMTLLGVHNYELYNEDFLLADTHECANKVFCDGPISMKYDNPLVFRQPWFKDTNTKDGDLLILYKALDSIKEGGRAVIAVPGRVLFSSHPSYEKLRKVYTENGLKAVITLPPLWAGTMINTNLIVLEKGYKSSVEFIDASKLGMVDKQRRYTLLDEDIENICSSIAESKNVDGFCQAVDYRDVICNNSWQPNKYINVASDINVRSVKEIDSELDSLYEELKNNLK